MKQLSLGLDIGGTNTVIGLFNESDELISKSAMRTEHQQGISDYVKRLNQEIWSLLEQQKPYTLAGIGAGVPGHLHAETGTVLRAPNLGWYDVKLGSLLEEHWRVPVAIDNDVRMYAWGEYAAGAARGCQNFICVTLGTGLAAGVVMNGGLIRGAHGYAGEIGHDPVEGNDLPCKCGKTGCLETMASATGIARLAEAAMKRGQRSILQDQAAAISAKDVCIAAEQGDALALEVFENIGSVLGRKLATMTYLLDPELIVVGGGAANAGEMLLAPIRRTLHSLYPKAHQPDVVQGQLGDSAGLYGAALSLASVRGEGNQA
ncbi:Glucokinase [Paenibacillus algicola]|uniref:Glucokinase n=1 Tax=Paenibacillus algicola TaxID=2565926 RepID=A0A4P8XSR0_9BACL|nr:ROK family protein [Paenibacillus algicola]QCT03709.1 Glucokinase [Paenibacillus algicola]